MKEVSWDHGTLINMVSIPTEIDIDDLEFDPEEFMLSN